MSNTAYRIDLSDNVFFDFDQRIYHHILYVFLFDHIILHTQIEIN